MAGETKTAPLVGACKQCSQFMVRVPPLSSPSDDTASPNNKPGCPICLGAWTGALRGPLTDAIRQQAVSYLGANRFSRESRLVILPGDVLYRQKALSGNDNTTDSLRFCQQLKQHCQTTLDECLEELEQKNDNGNNALDSYPPCVSKEEQGFLGVHVILMPSKTCYRPPVAATTAISKKTKRRGQHQQQHCEPSQGGDPKFNLETRLGREPGVHLWTFKQAQTTLLSSTVSIEDDERDSLLEAKNEPLALDIRVAIWRRPFYLRSMYTKTLRDISQTPFHVVEQDGKRRKLGRTSVEEEIRPAVLRACGGISDENNTYEKEEGSRQNHQNKVFGMAKFHASGREDMDVRMILPATKATSPGVSITGRPFVLEIFDAYQLPTMEALKSIVSEINSGVDEYSADGRSYGRNPAGVGISSELAFVPAESFKLLQGETESKVKFYGCLCWSQHPLPPTTAELNAALGSFPLDIAQTTPIRVLHRRTNSVRMRKVLTCQAERVDEHYFRLHLSTTAGTYVKEFVHGDLGRTLPSISSLLDCTTDILELDCEGIQL